MAEETQQSSRWRPGHSGHHLRPSSRGGNHTTINVDIVEGHDTANVVEIDSKALHRPYHTLFFNLWPHEAAFLLFFSWVTLVPHRNRARYARDAFGGYDRAWETLFGGIEDPLNAVSCIYSNFARSNEVREFALYARKIIQYAQAHSTVSIYDYIRTIPGAWTKDDSYIRLFHELYPHEVIILVMLSWRTICPHKERTLANTLLDKDGRPAKESFRKRIDAWNTLFGEHATPWEVVEAIKRKFGGSRRSPTWQLIIQAKRFCRRMEKSGLLQF